MKDVNPTERHEERTGLDDARNDDAHKQIAERAADEAATLYATAEQEHRQHRFELAVSRASASGA